MSVSRSLTTALAVLVLAAPLAAQRTAAGSAWPDSTVAVATPPVVTPVIEVTAVTSQSPTLANAAVGIRATTSVTTSAPAAAPPQGSVGRNPAMMIVGGVALIVGSFLDDPARPIVMISGAAIGLYGLWQYLK